MYCLRIAAFSFGLGFATCQATEITLVSTQDTTIFEDSDDKSNGSGSHLFSGATANKNSGLVRRALLGFDLASLPMGATITDVSLSMRVNKVPSRAVTNDFSLHRLLQGWGEGASDASGAEGKGATARDGDATWAESVVGTSEWTDAGGDFLSDASSSVSIGGTGPYTWDSTESLVADVQSWLDAPDMNFGWILIGDEEQARTAKRFASRTSSNPPTLTIDFEFASLLGDFDEDGELNVPDIDQLCSAINGGDNPNTFDLNEDGAVSADDLTVWVEDLAGSFFGDTDLNGTVEFADFLALSSAFGQEDNWAHGDVDCSGTVEFSDFLSLSANFGNKAGQEAAIVSVPEPATQSLLVLAAFHLVSGWRKRP